VAQAAGLIQHAPQAWQGRSCCWRAGGDRGRADGRTLYREIAQRPGPSGVDSSREIARSSPQGRDAATPLGLGFPVAQRLNSPGHREDSPGRAAARPPRFGQLRGWPQGGPISGGGVVHDFRPDAVRSRAGLCALHDNPGGDHGLRTAIPAEDLPWRHLEILPLDLAPLADVCSHDASRTGFDPATCGPAALCATQLRGTCSANGFPRSDRSYLPSRSLPAGAGCRGSPA
jgi:hypothetical protein